MTCNKAKQSQICIHVSEFQFFFFSMHLLFASKIAILYIKVIIF